MKLDSHGKVAIAMSGGVDSSVAAALLVQAGYDCFGVFMHFWAEPGRKAERENLCCSLASYHDARRVCQKLGIKLYTLNFDSYFKKTIVDDFLKEYGAGQTPNPCVRCNKYIKFGELLKKTQKLGASYLATGHYIKIANRQPPSANRYKLFTAKDKDKDQSYFLYNLKQEQLKHLLFPLGGYTKPEVRKLAKKFGLAVAEKRESQEICFIADKDHNEFLRRHLRLKPGKIATLDGKVVGSHLGLPLYTLGQRRGIGLGGGPYFVAGFNRKKNQLLVTTNKNNSALLKKEFLVKEVNWIADTAPKLPLKCLVKTRYRQTALSAMVKKQGKNYLVKLSKPGRAVAAGQSAVFYQPAGSGTELLGGGIIK
ncbi:MAG: tRNA 2-thiouridine(34) synthase MnmA [Patescibacteria group bacterium]|jgi:tRNA-specific 2-thiouridylase